MVDPRFGEMLEKQIQTLEKNLNDRLDLTERTMGERLTRQDKALGRIEEKVDKTNGRVTGLELWRARVEGLKDAFNWFPPLLSGLLCTGIATLVTWLITQ